MREGRTRRYAFARSQLLLPPFLPQPITWSAIFCASLAFATVVVIVSCWRREETRLRRSKRRWAVGRLSDLLARRWRMLG